MYENRIDNERNNLGLYERELRDRALLMAQQYGRQSTEGRVPVRVDKNTVIYKKIK
jgi:hypothetical protein